MEDSSSSQSRLGSLERWTIGLFALSGLFYVFTWIPAVVCLFISKVWTVQEKLIALIAPLVAAAILASVIINAEVAQDWILFPLVLTFAGLPQLGAAIYLAVRGRSERELVAATA
jgi:hypothetical protein